MLQNFVEGREQGKTAQQMKEEIEKQEKDQKDKQRSEELKKQLEVLESQAEKMKQGLVRKYNEKGERLLSYEDGFGWCSGCRHVSYIPKTSDMRGLRMKGCQRRGCPNHLSLKDGWSPYQPEDFVYEGRKEIEECMWYTSGKGCPQGNKCSLTHMKWDETLKSNKGRCYVCGDKAHTSRDCTRPRGAEEGAGVLTMEQRVDMFSIFRKPPPRPNGQEVSLKAPAESHEEMSRRLQKEERRLKNQRTCKHLKDTITLFEGRGESTEKLINDLLVLATEEEYFEGRDEIPLFIDEFRVKEAISKRKEIEEISRQGLADRAARRSSQSPSRPRINMVKVLKKSKSKKKNKVLHHIGKES